MKHYQYYVEGQDERNLLTELKTKMRLIQPGKIQVLNVIQNNIRDSHLMQLKDNTVVVFVFDTDKEGGTTLDKNIALCKQHEKVREVLCIPQVKNLEDELIRSCNISPIIELLPSRSLSNFKTDFAKEKKLKEKLEKKNFDIRTFWSQIPDDDYKHISNDADKIKIIPKDGR